MAETIKVFMMHFCNQNMTSVQGYLREVEDTLCALQRLVHGYIQTVPIGEHTGILLICNEEGKLDNLPLNRLLFVDDGEGELELIDTIVGDCFCCRFDGCEGFASIKESDIPIIQKYLKPVFCYEDNVAILTEEMAMSKEDYISMVLDKEKIKSGVFIRLISDIQDPYTPIKAGAIMAVGYIDDANQIHGIWQSPYKSSIAIIPEVDNFEIIEGGLPAVKKMKAAEIFEKMSIDSISIDDWYNISDELITSFYNREIDEEALMSKAWKILLKHKHQLME